MKKFIATTMYDYLNEARTRQYVYVRIRKNNYDDLTKAIEGLVAIGYTYTPEGWNDQFNKNVDSPTFDGVYGYPDGHIDINLMVNTKGAIDLTSTIMFGH